MTGCATGWMAERGYANGWPPDLWQHGAPQACAVNAWVPSAFLAGGVASHSELFSRPAMAACAGGGNKHPVACRGKQAPFPRPKALLDLHRGRIMYDDRHAKSTG